MPNSLFRVYGITFKLLSNIWPKSPDPFGSVSFIEVSSRYPESKKNLPNVDRILFILFSPTLFKKT